MTRQELAGNDPQSPVPEAGESPSGHLGSPSEGGVKLSGTFLLLL